jgi:hypothetical protein
LYLSRSCRISVSNCTALAKTMRKRKISTAAVKMTGRQPRRSDRLVEAKQHKQVENATFVRSCHHFAWTFDVCEDRR